jgi:hypothetical protein
MTTNRIIPLCTNRYESIGEHETFSVELPDGIGVVHIRTGSVHGPTGFPMVAVEVVSHSVDTPAADGRLYEPQFKPMHNTIFMVGRPTTTTTTEES